MSFCVECLLCFVSVESSTTDLVNSCEYAVGGYCEEAPVYFASDVHNNECQLSSVTDAFPHVLTDICDMCGHLLPPVNDEHLRQKHIQVQYSNTVLTVTLLLIGNGA